jgi:L-lactate utilization protein LutB
VLRKEFLAADMGISGCNFAIAETGTSASSPTRATGA